MTANPIHASARENSTTARNGRVPIRTAHHAHVRRDADRLRSATERSPAAVSSAITTAPSGSTSRQPGPVDAADAGGGGARSGADRQRGPAVARQAVVTVHQHRRELIRGHQRTSVADSRPRRTHLLLSPVRRPELRSHLVTHVTRASTASNHDVVNSSCP